jgi:Lipopolysaccharide export system permease LptF/LptG
MLSSRQLFGAMDSMSRLNSAVTSDLNRAIREMMAPLKSKVVMLPPSSGASTPQTVESSTPSVSSQKMAENVVVTPPKTMDNATLKKIKKGEKDISTSLESVRNKLDSINKISRGAAGSEIGQITPVAKVVKKDSFRNKALVDDFYGIVPATAQSERLGLEQRAENSAKNVQSNIENTMRQAKSNNDQRGKFVYELHMKYTAAIICFVFLFIGAPMGAIIQKGGFGYPILVAIGFFVVYIIGTIYCKNIKDGGGLSPTSAAWLPVLFMLPIALLLTWRAVNDYKMSFDGTGKKLKILYDKTLGKWIVRRKKAIVQA